VNGVTEPLEQLRSAVTSVEESPAVMAPYLEKVRNRAYSVTDDDVAALRTAGVSEDEIFEQTVVTAIVEGLRRLDIGLEAIG